MLRSTYLLLSVALIAGCALLDDEEPAVGGGSFQTPQSAPALWTTVGGPCPGSQTNALHFDSVDNGFIGCGENAEGTGLFETTDGGETWRSVEDFDRVRVSDIRRSPDGDLLIAGKDTSGPAIGYRVDDTSIETLVEYGPSAPFMRIGHAENLVVAADGAAMIDSLTGSYIGYRESADDEFVEFRELDDDTGSPISVRRLGLREGEFFGVGGVINDPAQVYLQSPDGRPLFTTVMLGTNDGEAYDFAFVGDEALVVGWDQTDREPLMYRGSGDLSDAENWVRQDLTSLVRQGAIRGIHAQGDALLVVGERFPTSQGGFALYSADGGQSWSDVTPDNANVLSRGWLFKDGRAVVAGAGNFVAIGEPR